MTTTKTVKLAALISEPEHRALKAKLAIKGQTFKDWIQQQVTAELAKTK